MTATVEDVGRGGGEQDSQRGCACSHNSRGASLGELQATAPLERTTTMKFSPAFVSLLALVPYVAAAGVHKLPLKKLAPAAANPSLETAYLAEKYGGQASFQTPMAGAGGSGRRLRYADDDNARLRRRRAKQETRSAASRVQIVISIVIVHLWATARDSDGGIDGGPAHTHRCFQPEAPARTPTVEPEGPPRDLPRTRATDRGRPQVQTGPHRYAGACVCVAAVLWGSGAPTARAQAQLGSREGEGVLSCSR